MPSAGKTLIYPREDNKFKTFESVPYDAAQTQVWTNRPVLREERFKEWIAYFYLGILIGTIAFLMTLVEEILSEEIVHLFENYI